MTTAAESLLASALVLPQSERAALIDALTSSLHMPSAAHVDAAWRAEVDARLAAHDRDSTKAVDSALVFAEILAR